MITDEMRASAPICPKHEEQMSLMDCMDGSVAAHCNSCISAFDFILKGGIDASPHSLFAPYK